MGLLDFMKKKDVPSTPTPPAHTTKKVVVNQPKVEKNKIIEKIGKFYRTEDGIFHKKYNITGTQYLKRPQNWIKVRVGDSVSFKFYKFEGNPAVEVIHKNGSLGNIKAFNAPQVTLYKDILTGGTIFSAVAHVRKIQAVIELNFKESEEDKIREIADQEFMMVDKLSDTRIPTDDNSDDLDEDY